MTQSSTSAYDHLLKILLIGDTSSNKRTLLRTYLEDQDISDTTTLGLDYKLKDVMHKGKIIKLQLWDTAGQERFRSVTASYYRGAHGALLCFTLSKDPSFIGINYWLEEIKNNAPINFQVMLVATDAQSEEGGMNLEMAKHFAREKQLPLFACDVEDSTRVQEVFQSLVERIMDAIEADGGRSRADSIRLGDFDQSYSRQSRCRC